MFHESHKLAPLDIDGIWRQAGAMTAATEVEVFGVPFSPQQARNLLSFLISKGRGIDFAPLQDLLDESGVATLDGWGINNYGSNLEWKDATEARGGGSGSAFKEELARQIGLL
jgi:hypothetical protein